MNLDVVTLNEKAVGKQRWNSELPVSLDSTFWAYSCTKLFTTIAALQCVERGLIDLDEDLSSHLPELQGVDIISKGADGDFELTSKKSNITLRQLLTHTSGINYDAMNPLTQAWRKSRGEAPLVFTGRVKDSYSTPLLFEPGKGWVYGGGIDWAGILISRLCSVATLGDYMEKSIFQPLGLKSTTFDPHSRPDLEARLIEMSSRDSNGILSAIPSPYNSAAPEHSGGMGLVTSTADLSAVLKDLLQEEPSLLQRQTVELMFQPAFPVGSIEHRGFLEQKASPHSIRCPILRCCLISSPFSPFSYH